MDDALGLLEARWPDPSPELHARAAWERLVGGILAAGTSAERANQALAVLSEHLVGVPAYARLALPDLEAALSRFPSGRVKARAISEAARAVLRRHRGAVPADEVALRALPGVDAAVAAGVLADAFGRPAVADDAGLRRVVLRLGWCGTEPRAARQAVMDRLPETVWTRRSRQLTLLSRACCRPLRPRCGDCPLAATCLRQGVDGWRRHATP